MILNFRIISLFECSGEGILKKTVWIFKLESDDLRVGFIGLKQYLGLLGNMYWEQVLANDG